VEGKINPSFFLCLDSMGTTLDGSPELVGLLGLPSPLKGTNFLSLEEVKESGIANDFLEVLRTGSPRVFHRKYPKGDGKALPLRTELRPIKDLEGRVILVLMLLEETEPSAAARQGNRETHRMEAMEELVRSMGRFLTGELRVIMDRSEMALREMRGDEKPRKDLLEIRKAGQRAHLLVQRLLAFAGGQPQAPECLDLNGLIMELKDTIASFLGEKVDLVVSLDPRLHAVKVDPGQMEAVILNLVMNAKEAMPDGGRLFIETRNLFLDQDHGWIHGTEVIPGWYVMLSITDTGKGMDQETQSRIFEPFFTTKGASGLGLSVVHGIVKQSSGYIWAYSEPGMGTTFKIYLPSEGEISREERREEPLGKEPSGASILIASDERKVLDMAGAILEGSGFHVFKAEDPMEAMQIARRLPRLDLLIVEELLAGIPGEELWERMRSIRPELRAIVISGTPGEKLEKGRRGAGRDLPQIYRVFSRKELLAKVNEAMSQPPPSFFREVPRVSPELSQPPGPQKPRILIVDDEAPIRRILSKLLTEQGYECSAAANAVEAKEKLARESFDLLLCDVRMPGESGLELVEEVMPSFPDMPVVFISGVNDPKVAQMALERGAYGYILKPFKLNEVVIQVANALRRKELEALHRIHMRELERKVDERTQELQLALSQLRQTMDGIVRAISLTVEVKDPYTAGHQKRVALLARLLAKKLGLPPGTIEGIYVAGTIHDLGKISVPAEILSKPATLTAIEFSLIKTHPDVGYEILKPIQFPWPIAEMVRQHHERMDGSGYPRGLKGEEILLEARILAVADVVEAISSHRPYRPALGLERAMEELKNGKGTLYDPQVVEACLELLAQKVRDLSLLDQIS